MSVSDIKVKISAFTNGFDEAISKVQNSLGRLNQTGQGAGATAARWGNAFTSAGKALLPASIAAGVLTGATVKLGSEYQAQMGKVQAISGTTASEMARLKVAAMDATQDTKYTAIEAGQAYEYMGMAGWKSGQMIDGLKPILDLATAAGADLGITSDIVTDSLTAFGLKAKDTAMFADVLAAASTNSNTNVQMMGETFKYAAPIAGTLGYSVQDTAVAIGLMANAGIKGSQAGTTLRTALSNLAAPTSKMKATMQQLGIHTTDAQGKMLPLRNVIDQLRTSFSGLSKDQQAQTAETLFGKEAMSGMLAIINSSEGDYNKLTSAIDNSTGAASRMAKTMSDSAPIQTAIASIKNSMIQTGEVIMPFVAKIAQGVAKLAQGFQKLPGPVKGAIIGLVGIVAVAAPMLLFVGNLLTGFAALQAVAAGLGVGVMALVGPFLAIIAAIAAVIAIGVAVYQNWDTIKAKASEIGQAIQQAWNGVKEFFSNLWEGIKTTLLNAWNSIKEIASVVWSAITMGIMGAISPLAVFLLNNWESIKDTAVSVWNSLSGALSGIWSGISAVAQTIFDVIKIGLSVVWDAIKTTAVSIWNGIKATLTSIWNGIKSTVKGVFDIIKTIISAAWNIVKTVTVGVWNVIKALLTGNFEAIKGIVSETWNSIKATISAAWMMIRTTTTNIWNGIKSAISGALNAIKSTFVNIFNGIKAAVTTGMVMVKSTITNGINRARSAVAGMVGAFISAGRNLVSGIARGIISGIGNVISAAVSAVRRAINAAKSAAGIHSPSKVMAREVGRWIPAGMAVGIKTNTDSVANQMKDLNDIVVNSALPIREVALNKPDYNIGDLQNRMDMEINKSYSFVLKLGNKAFKAFARDIEGMNDRELDLVEYSLL